MTSVLSVIYAFTIFSLWISTLMTLIQQYGAFKGHFKNLREDIDIDALYHENLPPVTIMVPAHNEEKVIIGTCLKIMKLNYPKDKIELIVVNDASTDTSKDLLAKFQLRYPDFDMTVINTTKEDGGKGKSQALEQAIAISKYDILGVYDADAAPEQNALLLLVHKLLEDASHGAAFGRNKCRNRDHNLLTKFITLETITTQKIEHIADWQLHQLGKIPGTNYIIKKSALEEAGGFTHEALTEDTDLSFKLYRLGYKIAYEVRSEAYQQEPETLKVFHKQRKRWAKGNIDVLIRNLKYFFKGPSQLRQSLFSLFVTYFWFIIVIFLSDVFFILQLRIIIHNAIFTNQLPNLFNFDEHQINLLVISWAILFFTFILYINFALVTEIGQSTVNNYLVSVLSYFTYAQLFFIVSLIGIFSYIFDRIFKRESKWYKTERFD